MRTRSYSCAPNAASSAAKAASLASRNGSGADGQRPNTPRYFTSVKRKFTRTLSNERLVDNMFDDRVLLEHDGHGGSGIIRPETPELFHDSGNASSFISSGASKRSGSFTSRPKIEDITRYESLDYDQCENMLQLEEGMLATRRGLDKNIDVTRWIVILLIGILTGLTAVFVLYCVDILTTYKYIKLMGFLNDADGNPTWSVLMKPYLIWLVANGFPVFLGSILVTYVAPVAAGSGIPVIKCYLNGVKIPEVVRIKTYFAKMLGVIGSVSGGLACGKEGPMIHCGSVIAAGISQGKSTTFQRDWHLGLTRFREDHEKRDFVSAGKFFILVLIFMF